MWLYLQTWGMVWSHLLPLTPIDKETLGPPLHTAHQLTYLLITVKMHGFFEKERKRKELASYLQWHECSLSSYYLACSYIFLQATGPGLMDWITTPLASLYHPSSTNQKKNKNQKKWPVLNCACESVNERVGKCFNSWLIKIIDDSLSVLVLICCYMVFDHITCIYYKQ